MANTVNEEDLVRMHQKGILSDEEYLDALSKLHGHNGRPMTPPKKPIDPEKMRKRIVFSVVLLGIFSVLAGFGLIIADNWEYIPSAVKVAGGLGLLATSLVTTAYFKKYEKPLWMEAFLFISFLLIGSNIALIQQVYHLPLSWQDGSLIWFVFSLPLCFFTRYKLLPMCSIGLLTFSVWDYIWDMNYMLIAGMMFMIMMLTHFFNGSMARLIRHIAFITALFVLFSGDAYSHSGMGVAGLISTTVFVILALSTSRTTEGIIRFYNYLFLFVAWRIFLLFWNASYELTNIGIMLIVFGGILLAGVGLYTYYYKQIQDAIKRFVDHE